MQQYTLWQIKNVHYKICGTKKKIIFTSYLALYLLILTLQHNQEKCLSSQYCVKSYLFTFFTSYWILQSLVALQIVICCSNVAL